MKAVREFLDLIKFEHTIFALPFAYLGMLLAAQGWPTWYQFIWITIAMIAARTLAMGSNRIADRWIDARNPRTAQRPLITGSISIHTAWIGTTISGLVLALAAWQLGPLTFILLPGAYLFLIGYSFTKRFTWLSHFILGFTDGLAPVGAWVAIRGTLFTSDDRPAWILRGVVTFWIARRRLAINSGKIWYSECFMDLDNLSHYHHCFAHQPRISLGFGLAVLDRSDHCQCFINMGT